MSRLAFVLGVVLVLATDLALGQAEEMWRVGVLMPECEGALEAIVEGLAALRDVEGRNMTLDVRRAARGEQLPSLALELVEQSPM